MATSVCATGVYAHSVSHAHFLCIFFLRDVQTLTRMAQVYVISLHLPLSILMFHPPSLLFSHGHFDTTFPYAPSSSSFIRPKNAGQAHLRTCAGEFGFLANPTHLTASGIRTVRRMCFVSAVSTILFIPSNSVHLQACASVLGTEEDTFFFFVHTCLVVFARRFPCLNS